MTELRTVTVEWYKGEKNAKIDYVGHMPSPPRMAFYGEDATEEEKQQYWQYHAAFRKSYNSCARCETDEHTKFFNCDAMWGDGDLICTQCDGYVRVRDSG